jgi:hypothetical protein
LSDSVEGLREDCGIGNEEFQVAIEYMMDENIKRLLDLQENISFNRVIPVSDRKGIP